MITYTISPEVRSLFPATIVDKQLSKTELLKALVDVGWKLTETDSKTTLYGCPMLYSKEEVEADTWEFRGIRRRPYKGIPVASMCPSVYRDEFLAGVYKYCKDSGVEVQPMLDLLTEAYDWQNCEYDGPQQAMTCGYEAVKAFGVTL